MKIKNIYLIGAVVILILGACESLEQEVRTTLALDQVYRSYERVVQMGTSAYTSLPLGFIRIDGAMLASSCDEAEHTDETSNIQKFNIAAWGPIDNPDNIWGTLYTGIRRANDCLANTDSINWGGLVLNPTPENHALYLARTAEIKRIRYEVRFLRVFYYFELIKRYGGVPIVTERLPIDADFSGIDREPLEDCIDFIIAECDSAAKNLPWNYVAQELGRITKGAALALKSRVLLYAASDLFNTPPAGYANPELVSLPAGDRTARWQAAADAAKMVIDSASKAPYSLATDYKALFKTFNNNEIIFVRRSNATNTFEKANYPIGYDLGKSGTTPSQNLVDAFEVKVDASTAIPFDWNNPDHAANPYAPAGTLGRDPRLKMIVLTNNTTFKGRPVECWENGKDGKGVPLATRTGYYLMKYLDENLDLLLNNTSVHSWIYIRYAEILLNYAEAINEADPGNVALAKAVVDQVRARTGVAMPPLPAGLTQAEMRDKIRNERRVEFAFEEHRQWDVRRWMLGETYFNVPLRGVAITENTGVFTYTPIDVENRVFSSKMNFYPIPQTELNIMTSWKQNPGW